MPPVDEETLHDALKFAHDNGDRKQGRLGTLEKQVAAQQQQIDTLQQLVETLAGDHADTINTLAWLHAEALHKTKLATVQQIMSRPEVQQKIQQALLAKIDQGIS